MCLSATGWCITQLWMFLSRFLRGSLFFTLTPAVKEREPTLRPVMLLNVQDARRSGAFLSWKTWAFSKNPGIRKNFPWSTIFRLAHYHQQNIPAFQNKTPNEKSVERNPEILWKGENHRRKSSGKDKSRVCSTEADKCRIHKNYESIRLIFFCIARELDWVLSFASDFVHNRPLELVTLFYF